MTNSHQLINTIKLKYQAVYPFLNERGRRVWAAAEAVSLGRGGISLVGQATGLSSTSQRNFGL